MKTNIVSLVPDFVTSLTMRYLTLILPFILFYCEKDIVMPDYSELIRRDSLEMVEGFKENGDFFRDNLSSLFNLRYPSPFLSNVDSIYIESVRITSEHQFNNWYDHYEFQVRKNNPDYSEHPIFWPYEFTFTFFVMVPPNQGPIYLFSTLDTQEFSRVLKRGVRKEFLFATFTFHHTREDFYKPYTARIGRSNVAKF